MYWDMARRLAANGSVDRVGESGRTVERKLKSSIAEAVGAVEIQLRLVARDESCDEAPGKMRTALIYLPQIEGVSSKTQQAVDQICLRTFCFIGLRSHVRGEATRTPTCRFRV